MLIVFGGLPGTGKTTLSRALARHLGAAHVRVDTIEHALARPGTDVGEAGYVVGYAIAEDNLRLGRVVVADSVNPLPVTREAWRAVAARTGVPCFEVEIGCSDRAEHRRRIDTRASAPAMPLTWNDVETRRYEPWATPQLVIDTAGRTPEDCLADIIEALARFPSPSEITRTTANPDTRACS